MASSLDMALPDQPVRFTLGRSLLIIVLGFLIVCILAWQASLPIKRALAIRYVARGDTYMIQNNYNRAVQEYQSALKNDSQNAEALRKETIAVEASTDIASARDLFQELGQTSMVTKIDQATKPFDSPKAALQAGVSYYQASEYSLARYPLETALQLDPNYPEAWHYLALVYDKLATYSSVFKDKATDARSKRDALSPLWIGQ